MSHKCQVSFLFCFIDAIEEVSAIILSAVSILQLQSSPRFHAVLICSDLLTVLQPPLLSISPKASPNFLTTNIVIKVLTVKMALRFEVASDSLHAASLVLLWP